MTHLVVRQAVVFRYKQCGLDRQTAEVLHKTPPRLGHLGVIEDLLQRTERKAVQVCETWLCGEMVTQQRRSQLTVRKLENVGVDWRTCSRFPVQMKPSPM